MDDSPLKKWDSGRSGDEYRSLTNMQMLAKLRHIFPAISCKTTIQVIQNCGPIHEIPKAAWEKTEKCLDSGQYDKIEMGVTFVVLMPGKWMWRGEKWHGIIIAAYSEDWDVVYRYRATLYWNSLYLINQALQTLGAF